MLGKGAARTDSMGDIEAVARWLTWLKGQGRSRRTIGIYRSAVGRFLFEYVGTGPQDATEEHVSSFLSDIGEQGPSGRRQAWQALHSAFAYWLRRGVVSEDPTAEVVVKKPRKRRQVALSEEEIYRVFCAAWERDPMRAWALALDFGLGTRRMELCGIDPARDIQGDEVELRHCKGGKTRRVPLSNLAREALKQLRPWYNGTVLGGTKPGTLSYWANRAAKDAGIYEKVRGRSLHVLRASYASHLLDRGASIVAVRDLLGHESIATTNEYSVALGNAGREAVALL